MKVKMIILLMLGIFSITGVLGGCNSSSNNSTLNNSSNSEENSTEADNKIDEPNKVSDSKVNESNIASDSKNDNTNEDIKESTDKSNGDSKESVDKSKEYTIFNKIYSKNNVKITYPQIKDFSDISKLNLINKDLEEGALSILSMYDKDDPNLSELTMEINHEVKLKNNKYISIVYSGYSNVKGAAYSPSVFYTTNIDLKNGTIIKLVDYANVDNIVKKLKDKNDVKVLSNETEFKEAQMSAIINMDNAELLTILKDSDFHMENGKLALPEKGAYSYMDGDNVVISLQLNHALGDHGEFSVQK